MTTPFTRYAAIPDLIWSSLQEVLTAKMVEMAKDVAKTINKDPAPLVKFVKTNAASFYLFDESQSHEIDMRCKYMCQKPAAPLFIQPCGRPIVWSSGIPNGSERCAEHAYSAVPKPSNLPCLQPIEYDEDTLYLGEDDTVYNVSYEAVGRMNRETGSLFRFRIL